MINLFNNLGVSLSVNSSLLIGALSFSATKDAPYPDLVTAVIIFSGEVTFSS